MLLIILHRSQDQNRKEMLMPMQNRIPKNRYNGSGTNTESSKVQQTMTSAMLPNMELDTGLFRLKVDDDGIFFEINHPFRKRKQRDIYDACNEEPNGGNDDDDEEGLIYDGD